MTGGTIPLEDAAATGALGTTLAALLRPGDVVALAGTLGAGKTTLARGVLEGLGFAGDVPSPSFPIAIPYAPPDVRLPIWHVDLYRLSSPEECAELGLEEALADGALLIEWPDRLGGALWADALRLELADDGAGRRLTWAAPTAWEGRWPPNRP